MSSRIKKMVPEFQDKCKDANNSRLIAYILGGNAPN